MDPTRFLDLDAGIGIGVLAYIVFALLRGWLHTDKEFRREVERGDKWETVALDALSLGHQSAEVASTAIKKVGRGRSS